MSMNINNSLLNGRTFLTETHLDTAKKEKFGDTTSDTEMISSKVADNVINTLSEKEASDLSSIIAKTMPELTPPQDKGNAVVQHAALQGIADRIYQLSGASDENANTKPVARKEELEYKKVNEHAFVALYSKLLALFSSLNASSSKLTGIHAQLAEKLAKSSGDKMVQAAVAQKNQAIAMGATSMGVSGVGLAMSNRGINQQQQAIKENSVSLSLNDVNRNLDNTVTNGANLNQLQQPEMSNERAATAIVNHNTGMHSSNGGEFELSKLAGRKKTDTGSTVSGMGQPAGNLISSGYGVESASENAAAQMDNVGKDNMLETEVKNRENQNAARASLKTLLDLIYQSIEKNNDAVSHTAQMLKV